MSDAEMNPLLAAAKGEMDTGGMHEPEQSGASPNGVRGGVFTPSLATLGGDDEDDVQLETPDAGKGKRYAVVAGVLALGLGVLMTMRHLGSGPREATASVAIDYAFADEEQRKAAEAQREVIEDFERTGPPVQLPPQAIDRNPFLLSKESGVIGVEGPAGETPVVVDRRAEEIANALSRLTVQAVIDGRVPVARISGETCRIGDVVAGRFTVQEIEGHQVVLRSELGQHRLVMGDDE